MATERRNPNSVDIDLFPTERILRIINAEDATVARAVETAIPDVARAADLAVAAIHGGGRIIYAGAGTSGRLAALDAAESPPTFGIPEDWVQFIMAGGPKAAERAIEGAEDNAPQGAADLKKKKCCDKDLIIGLSASGRTPYTLGALEYARSKGGKTVAVVATPDSPMSRVADICIHTPVGPEVIAGSTRMKAGTAQKLVLNMISTAAMIRLGMTYSNWMINVSMTNNKLKERGLQILKEILGVNTEEAMRLCEKAGGQLKLAVIMGTLGCGRAEAEAQLAASKGKLRQVVGHMSQGRE